MHTIYSEVYKHIIIIYKSICPVSVKSPKLELCWEYKIQQIKMYISFYLECAYSGIIRYHLLIVVTVFITFIDTNMKDMYK